MCTSFWHFIMIYITGCMRINLKSEVMLAVTYCREHSRLRNLYMCMCVYLWFYLCSSVYLWHVATPLHVIKELDSGSGFPRAPVVDFDRQEDAVLQAVLLQNCLPFSPHPLQHDPCEQVLTVSLGRGWGGGFALFSLPVPPPLPSPHSSHPSHAFSLSQPCPDVYCALFMLQI